VPSVPLITHQRQSRVARRVRTWQARKTRAFVRAGCFPAVLPPRLAWQRLAHIQHVVWTEPEIAYAMCQLPLLDQLELSVELLTDGATAQTELPTNVIPFRYRCTR